MFGSEEGLGAVLQQLPMWMHIGLGLAGVVGCALNLRRSYWVGVTMAGLALETTLSLFYQVALTLLRSGTWTVQKYSLVTLIGTPVGLMAKAAIIVGVIGLASVARSGGGVGGDRSNGTAQ
jgi:hypothetical protein